MIVASTIVPGRQQQPLLVQQAGAPWRRSPRSADASPADGESAGSSSRRDRIVARARCPQSGASTPSRTARPRSGIRQVEPLLHEVDTQHPLQRHRLRTVARLRVMRLDQPDQVHQESPRPSRPGSARGASPCPSVPRRRGKRRLLHRPSYRCCPLHAVSVIYFYLCRGSLASAAGHPQLERTDQEFEGVMPRRRPSTLRMRTGGKGGRRTERAFPQSRSGVLPRAREQRVFA